LGIVVAELVTNSYDHAFPDGQGAIIVLVRRTATAVGMATMTIRDNGKGFNVEADNKRHGLGLVRRLVEQVRGTVMSDTDHGTVWTIRFPVAYSVTL
jgi:two-component sensor histidine kinase